MSSAALDQGRAAMTRHAWAQAYAQLQAADAATPLEIDDLELLATAACLTGHDLRSNEYWTRAHSEALRLGDAPRAVRAIFWLILDHLTRAEWSQASGWLARAQRLIDEGGHDCPECGLLLVLWSRVHAKQGDGVAAAHAAAQAVELSQRFDDPELRVFSGMAYALTLMRAGQGAEAASLLDELMIAVTVADVSPIAIGTVYCAVIDVCQHVCDLARAREWTNALSKWTNAQPDLLPFRGHCLVHRAEIMRFSGDWEKASAEAQLACSWLERVTAELQSAEQTRGVPSNHYPTGAAFYELGEIHRAVGEYADAEQAYQRANQHGHAPEPGMSLLQLAQGRTDLAVASIQHAVDAFGTPRKRGKALAACVEIMLQAGKLPAARRAAEELTALGDVTNALYLRAISAQATGAVHLAEGDATAALADLRSAWMAWQELQAPYHGARVRLLLADCYRRLGDSTTEQLELDAARRVFERLGAAPDVAHVNKHLRSSAAGSASLTTREREVIRLVAEGKSNRVIAEQLAISERTVDRHVSNILRKLDLSSRSAAAFAYARGLVH